MVHRSSATAPAYEGNAGATEGRNVHFLPRVLISPYDNAWFVAIDEQEWLLGRLLLEQPARRQHSFEVSQMGERRAYQSSNERLK